MRIRSSGIWPSESSRSAIVRKGGGARVAGLMAILQHHGPRTILTPIPATGKQPRSATDLPGVDTPSIDGS